MTTSPKTIIKEYNGKGYPPRANRKVNGDRDKNQRHMLAPFEQCGCSKEVLQTIFQFMFYVKTKWILQKQKSFHETKICSHKSIKLSNILGLGLGVSLNHQRICFKKTMFPKAVCMPLWQRDQNFPLTEQSLGSEVTNKSIGTGLRASRSGFHVK